MPPGYNAVRHGWAWVSTRHARAQCPSYLVAVAICRDSNFEEFFGVNGGGEAGSTAGSEDPQPNLEERPLRPSCRFP